MLPKVLDCEFQLKAYKTNYPAAPHPCNTIVERQQNQCYMEHGFIPNLLEWLSWLGRVLFLISFPPMQQNVLRKKKKKRGTTVFDYYVTTLGGKPSTHSVLPKQ